MVTTIYWSEKCKLKFLTFFPSLVLTPFLQHFMLSKTFSLFLPSLHLIRLATWFFISLAFLKVLPTPSLFASVFIPSCT